MDAAPQRPKQRPAGSLDETDYQAQADFRCALRRYLRLAEEQAMRAGITPQQHLVLLLVRGHREYPAVSIGDLAEALQLRQSSVSLLVDRTVKRGLIERKEDPGDRRRSILSLTPEGQRLLDEVILGCRREMRELRGTLFNESLLRAIETSDA